MTEYFLTAIDTTGIQKYVFGSNNLKQIVGASGLINWATNDLVYENLVELGNTNIKYDNTSYKLDYLKSTIEGNSLDSELIYAGGGNTLIVFKNEELAHNFTKSITKEILLNANGLDLVVTHTKFQWDKEYLGDVAQKTLARLNEKKSARARSSPLMGLGVTASCQFTGFPAVELRNEELTNVVQACKGSIRVSKEVSDKLKYYKKADSYFKKMFPKVGEKGYEFVRDFNYFGTKHESSYIAVVHADGNGMGKRVHAVASGQNKSDKTTRENNREYINAMRKFSISVKEATISAIVKTVDQLMEKIESTLKQEKDDDLKETFKQMIHSNDKKTNEKKKKLPFRPIIIGGDDLTFVCDGRLGLTLTELYLRNLKSYELSDGKPMSAKAGVSIVNSHYPFSRAVSMAGELASSAKKRFQNEKSDVSSMDWHFGSAGSLDRLALIRERSFEVPYGNLCMRPVYLGDNIASNWHSWNNFSNIIKEFQGSKWVNRKNKQKSLYEALLGGPDVVERFMTFYGLNVDPGLPLITSNKDSSQTGWIGTYCTCFDALEAIDFFIPLDVDKS